jgi:hypothetical protein
MVKLLRLKGDSTKNDTEIRNMFTETVTVAPKSKLALRSVRVNLVNSPDFEDFDLQEDNTYDLTIGKGSGTVTVPKGDYESANRLLNACQVAANKNSLSTGTSPYAYVHWQKNGNKSKCDLYETTPDDAEFINNPNWFTFEGERAGAGITNKTIISTSDAVPQVFQETLIQTIPLTKNLMVGAIGTNQANTGTVQIGAVSASTGGVLYAIKANGVGGVNPDNLTGEYSVIINDVETVVSPSDADNINGFTITAPGTGYSVGDTGNLTGGTGVNATYRVTTEVGNNVTGVEITSSGNKGYRIGDVLTLAGSGAGDATITVNSLKPVVVIGDILQVQKEGSNVRLMLKRAGANTNVFNQTYALPDDVLDEQKHYWDIRGTPAANYPLQLNDVEVTIIDLNPDPSLLGSGVQTSGSIQFNSIQSLGFNRLGHFLGFPDSDSPYNGVGDPVVINSPRRFGGILNYPGVMLGIEGLDLETYSGNIDVQPQGLSIIDVLYPEDPDELNVIQMRVNDAMKLNIKNESTIGIRDLRLAFYRDAQNDLGKDTGRFEKLQFIGTPVVVLEIYDPDE